MKYSKRKDRYCCNVLNDNFHEIDSRLNDLEENGGGSGGGGSTDIDYSKIEFDTEEIVVETEATTLNILDSLTEIEANTESGKIAGALAVKELADSLGEINKRSNHSFDNISVEVGGSWTKVAEITPNYGSYLVVVSMIVPSLSTEATVTISVNGVSQSNTATILANVQNRRIQAIGFANVTQNYPTINIQAFSNTKFTCPFASINYVKLR